MRVEKNYTDGYILHVSVCVSIVNNLKSYIHTDLHEN